MRATTGTSTMKRGRETAACDLVDDYVEPGCTTLLAQNLRAAR